jgi:hypothetical protein
VLTAVLVGAISSAALAADLDVDGYLSATGNLNIDGNTASFGTEGLDAGYILNYVPATDTVEFYATSPTGAWRWHRGPTSGYVPQMNLSSASVLTLFNPSTNGVGIILNPAGNSSIGSTGAAPGKLLEVGFTSKADAGINVAGRLASEGVSLLTLYPNIQPYGGSIKNKQYGLRLIQSSINNLTGLDLDNYYSIYIDGPTRNSAAAEHATNHWGLYIEPSSYATNNYAAYFGGNVGIGTSVPSEKLEVSGNAKISGTLVVGGQPVLVANGSGANLTGLNASAISTGTISAARLPSEAVQLNSNQILTNKTINGAILTNSATVSGVLKASEAITSGIVGNRVTTMDGSTGRFMASGNAGGWDWLGLQFKGSAGTVGGGVYGQGGNDVLNSIYIGFGPAYPSATSMRWTQTQTVIPLTTPSSSSTTGALVVQGGVGVGGDTNVGGKLAVQGAMQLSDNVRVKNRAVIRVSAAGDIGMGSFTSGFDPETGLTQP